MGIAILKHNKQSKHDVATTDAQQLIHHIKEIRSRLLIIVAVLLLGMVVGYVFYEQIFNLLRSPLKTTLHYTSPAGSFNFVIEICFVVAILFALPVIVYNIIMFLQPALEKRLTKSRVYLTTLFSLLLAVSGAAFAFYTILPLALKFFFKFEIDGLVALISASDYLNFVINIVVTFAIIFQLPLIINTIDHIRPLSIKTLLKGEKYIIIGSVGIAVVVPFALDPVVQVLIASPIVILYNTSIVMVGIQHAIKNRRARKMARASLRLSRAAERGVAPINKNSVQREGFRQSSTQPQYEPTSIRTKKVSSPLIKNPNNRRVRSMDIIQPIGNQGKKPANSQPKTFVTSDISRKMLKRPPERSHAQVTPKPIAKMSNRNPYFINS